MTLKRSTSWGRTSLFINYFLPFVGRFATFLRKMPEFMAGALFLEISALFLYKLIRLGVFEVCLLFCGALENNFISSYKFFKVAARAGVAWVVETFSRKELANRKKEVRNFESIIRVSHNSFARNEVILVSRADWSRGIGSSDSLLCFYTVDQIFAEFNRSEVGLALYSTERTFSNRKK